MLAMDRHTDDYVSGEWMRKRDFLKLNFRTEIPTALRTLDNCPFEMLCGAPLYSTRMFGQSYVNFSYATAKNNFQLHFLAENPVISYRQRSQIFPQIRF